jgi:ABC-type branched-subunit amino acid transport system substrate-binding protein
MKSLRMHRLLLSSFVLGTASLAAWAETPGVTATTITVGTTSPQTGVAASGCKPLVDGAQAWFEKVNADGGVYGRKIVNKVLDDQYTAPQALANARELGPDVLAFFGGCGSIQPPAVQQVAIPDKIPYLFANAGVAHVTPDPNYRVIQSLFSDQLHGTAEYALKKYGAGKVFMVATRVTSFDENFAAAKAGIAAGGGTLVGNEAIVAGEADFTPLVLKIKAAKPDYLILSTGASDAARLGQTLLAQGAMPTKYILGISSLLIPAFLGPVGTTMDGKVLAPTLTPPPTSDKVQSCVEAFRKYAPKLTVDLQSLYGCASAQALVAALQDAGKNVTRESLLAAVDKWNNKQVSPLLPPLTFNAKRHVGMSGMALSGVEKGQLKDTGEVMPMPVR